MGWRNAYVKLTEDRDLNTVIDFVDHHNNFQSYFTEEEVKQMWENDEVPGEKLELQVLHNEKTDEYWAYLGNHGGMSFSFDWKEKYFPEITIYRSDDWPHYDDTEYNWADWPLLSVEKYQNILKSERKKECKKSK